MSASADTVAAGKVIRPNPDDMHGWTTDELDRIGGAQEMHMSGRRRAGAVRTPVIVWVVRCGDDLYVRSVNGPDAAWFRSTRPRHEGHISAGGVSTDVDFVDIDADDSVLQDDIDAAYRIKYGRYSSPVAAITSVLARSTTLRLLPHPQREN